MFKTPNGNGIERKRWRKRTSLTFRTRKTFRSTDQNYSKTSNYGFPKIIPGLESRESAETEFKPPGLFMEKPGTDFSGILFLCSRWSLDYILKILASSLQAFLRGDWKCAGDFRQKWGKSQN